MTETLFSTTAKKHFFNKLEKYIIMISVEFRNGGHFSLFEIVIKI